MKIELSSEPPHITVFLSERNLLTLLHKLFVRDITRTLTTHNIWIDDELAPFALALIVSEDDAVHYAGREPGDLNPSTIAWLRGQREKPEAADSHPPREPEMT